MASSRSFRARGRLTVFGLAVGFSAACEAGRPLNTSDSGTLGSGDCHVEAGVVATPGGHGLVVQPGCGVGRVEWSLPLVHARARGESGTVGIGIAAKIEMKPLASGGVGLAAEAGAAADITRQPRSAGAFTTLIATAAPAEPLQAHLNLGIARSRGAKTVPTWAVAVEYSPRAAGALFVESYGQGSGPPFYQLGGRMRLTKAIQLDASVGGQQAGGQAARYVSIGITVLADGSFLRGPRPTVR